MKKLGLLVVLGFLLSGYSVIGGKVRKGKLNDSEIAFIKESYHWDSEEFLIVSYRQPRVKCHYNNYKNLKSLVNAFDRLHSNIKEKNTKIISVSYDSESITDFIDSESVFADLNGFFQNTFFLNDKSCYALVVINRSGKYISKVGEYTHKQINSFIEDLSN